MTWLIVIVVGWVIFAIGRLALIISAFKESIGWGFAVLILSPIADLIFIIRNWAAARTGFFICVVGWVISYGGGMMFNMYEMPRLEEYLSSPAFEQRARQLESGEVDFGTFLKELFPADGEMPVEEEPGTITPDVNDQRYVGMKLDEVRQVLGDPDAVIKRGNATVWYYPQRGIELESRDGATVAAQSTVVFEDVEPE